MAKISKRNIQALENAVKRLDTVMQRIQQKHPNAILLFYDQGVTILDNDRADDTGLYAGRVPGWIDNERMQNADEDPVFDYTFECNTDVGGL